MKVLFAVSNEEISQAIIKKYQKEYKEIISHKNIYYFNAILKEIQKDKSYDRIVISEDLEAFSHNQYEQIDKFIFEKLDSISDEATNMKGVDIPIILICSDRRTKADPMLVKLFGIGIYNAILGNDRSVDEVCKLINRPRLKKEAKTYYKIDSEEVTYQAESENDVSEMEIQNILAHYKSLGKDEERYVDSFNNIYAQYNEAQLRIIAKFLPLNVRAVLEERSPKYQKIMSFNNRVSNELRQTKQKQQSGTSEKLLKSKEKSITMTKPVVIPSSVNMSGIRKMSRTKSVADTNVMYEPNQEKIDENVQRMNLQTIQDKEPVQQVVQQVNLEEQEPKVEKKGRGRPRKIQTETENVETTVKRGRGRPRKTPVEEQIAEIKEETILPGFDNFDEDKNVSSQENMNTVLPGILDDDNQENADVLLPGFDTDIFEEDNQKQADFSNINMSKPAEQYNTNTTSNGYNEYNNRYNTYNMDENHSYEQNMNSIGMTRESNNYVQTKDISSLLTSDKKIVTFIGTSKNGTSFIVNNVAELLSSMGINVAILDTTTNRNSYYIYTKNEEALRNIASRSIEELSQGIANGIQVNKNLTVFTALPDDRDFINRVDDILETLVKNYSLILIDCDFNTPIGYFKQSMETYLVQSLDILTIQPLTAFLRELKAKNVLDENKLKIVLNKFVKIRGINEKTIIGGMAFYNDPAMSFMTELFDRNLIKYITIPFEEEIYVKYLEGIINCDINLKGYSKNFMQILKALGNMVYPLVSGQGAYRPPTINENRTQSGVFSSSMNDTLNQMKRNY